MTFSTGRAWASGFRRTQLALGWWGALLLAGGWLHNSNARAWGSAAMLLVWVGIMLAGLVGAYLIARDMLASGMLFIWIIGLTLAFLLTWLILFPLNRNGAQLISSIWHLAFAVGYALNGYYMDRRLFWLAGWEALLAIFMLLVNFQVISWPDLSNNQGLAFGLGSGVPLLIAALPIWKER